MLGHASAPNTHTRVRIDHKQFNWEVTTVREKVEVGRSD